MASIWKRRGQECGLDLEKGSSSRPIPAHSGDPGGHPASFRALLSLLYHLHCAYSTSGPPTSSAANPRRSDCWCVASPWTPPRRPHLRPFPPTTSALPTGYPPPGWWQKRDSLAMESSGFITPN